MKSIIAVIFAILTLACSTDTTIVNTNNKVSANTPQNNYVETNSSIMKFFDEDGRLNTTFQVAGTYHSEFEILSSYAFNINAANIFLKSSASDIFLDSETGDIFLNTKVGFVFFNGAEVDNEGTIKANNYKSSSGSYGKTYTEEFEDKQGNLRTKVYENGLLVSYKINGIEQ